MNGENKPSLSFSLFENYVALHQVLTGEKPKTITLSAQVYDWYIQEAQRHADTLGLNQGFKNDKPTFLNIPVEQKFKIKIK